MHSSSDTVTSEGLKRTLSARHLVMISLGGSIGTGLFLASGAPVSQAGPAGALFAYALIGVMVYFLMTALAELSAFEPVSGSFAVYGEKYVDRGFGLAMGINYCYNWAIAVAVDLVAAQIIMQYWFADVPGWIWSVIFLAVMFAINFFSARSFGEAEFWFASVKVCAVIAFIITGLMLAAGVLPGHEAVGLKNWNLNGEGSFIGGFAAFMGVAMVVGYSFQGTELAGVAAGESKDPDRTIPAAIRSIFWRIILFYVLSIIVIGLLIPHNDPRLLENDLADIALSPFTLVFDNAGFPWAAAVMNVVVLTTVLSAGNSGMYAATRLVHTLAREERLPRVFAKVSESGVPRNALYAVTILSALCFLTTFLQTQSVYVWLLNTTGMGGFLCWLGIGLSHWRFRRGMQKQGQDLTLLPYRSPVFPLGSIYAFVLCTIVAVGQNTEAILSGDWLGMLATYIGILIFAGVWAGYKLLHPDDRLVRYEDMDFSARFAELEKHRKDGS